MSVSLQHQKGLKHIIFSYLKQDKKQLLEQLFVFQAGDGFLYMPVLLACGIGLYFSLPFEISVWGIAPLFIVSLTSAIAFYAMLSQYGLRKIITILCFSIALISGGSFAAKLRTHFVHTPVLEKELAPVNLSGTVFAIEPLPKTGEARIWLGDLEVEKLSADNTPRMIRIKVRKSSHLKPQQRVQVLAGLNPPSPPVIPGAFDFQRYAYFKSLGAVGFAYGAPEIIRQPEVSTIQSVLEELRLSISNQVKRAVPADLQGVMTTFLTGEKTAIEEDELQAMRDAGLAHLLAISGLHVGLIAGIVFFISRFAMALVPLWALKYPIKKYAAGIAFLAAFLYMLLVGSTVPTQRAMMMTGIALIAIMLDRSPFSMRMVALAATIILITMPESLLSASFQMSFAAVSVLIWAYDKMRPYTAHLYQDRGVVRRAGLYIGGIAMTSLLASFATMPFALYHFQHWSLYGLLANIFAMPVMGVVVMPLAVISYMAMCVDLAYYPLLVMGAGVEWILDVARYVAGLDGAVLYLPALSHLTFTCLVLAGVLWMIGPNIARIIAVLLCLISLYDPFDRPDIMISSNSKLVGYYDREAHRLYVSSLQAERYNREQWRQYLGSPEVLKWPLHGEEGPILCDEAACRFEARGLHISIPRQAYAFPKECEWADIMIVMKPPSPECGGAHIIDRLDTYYNGSISLYFHRDGTYQMKNSLDERGQRSWVF